MQGLIKEGMFHWSFLMISLGFLLWLEVRKSFQHLLLTILTSEHPFIKYLYTTGNDKRQYNKSRRGKLKQCSLFYFNLFYSSHHYYMVDANFIFI